MSTLIHCQQLLKRYGQHTALSDVSFEVSAGRPVALVGENGAGKSTLLNILCGYLKPTAGKVSIMGMAPGSAGLTGRLGALPQDAQFDPQLSVNHQLQFYARLQGQSRSQAKQQASQVLEYVGLLDKQYERPGELSHGMNKRLSIAQALLGDASSNIPELVLLDEPTAGLDPSHVKSIRDLLQSLSGKTTFLISSHNLDELEKLCHQVLFLQQGQLQQHIPETQADNGVLSLVLTQVDGPALLEKVRAMPGVAEASMGNNLRLQVSYDAGAYPTMDQQLLACLAEHGWQYRQLLRGSSLEDQLFGENT